MSKHTPGPWVLELDQKGGFHVLADRSRYSTVITSRGSWSLRADESHANARLIAAAPDLLAALEECIDDAEQAVTDYVLSYGEKWRPARLAALRETVAKARAAIAKATGEQP